MLKLVLSVFLLVLITSILSESDGYLGGDLIDFNTNLFTNQEFNDNSKIIGFTDSLENNSNLKRYLIFGSESGNELLTYANKIAHTASSSNGFFSIFVLRLYQYLYFEQVLRLNRVRCFHCQMLQNEKRIILPSQD